MNPIQPIHLKDQGAAVANLHAGLLFLIRNQVGISDNDRRILEQGLASELREQTFRDWTAHLVSLWQEQLADRFHLIKNGDVDQATADALNKILAELGAPADGDPIDPPKPVACEVRGVVRLADASPAREARVAAYDRDLRKEELLGETQTDSAGAYRIAYSDQQFRKREHGGADLVVKALAADGSLLAASPVLFNAPAKAVIDLTIPAQTLVPPTLFEKIAAALPPLLDGVKVEELEEDNEHQDLSFLAGETGFVKRDLARFVLARLLAQQGIQAEFWFAVLGGSLFQYAEQQSLKTQLATFAETLPALGEAAVRKALARGFDQKDIPEKLRGRVEEWVAAFLKFAARQTMGPTGSPTFTKQALDHAGITDPAKQEAFALLFNQHRAVTPELVEALQKDPRFEPAEIDNLRASYQLADLTRGDFSVVKTIKDAFAVRAPGQIRSLAMKSENEWIEFVRTNHARGAITIPMGLAGVPETPGAPQAPPAELYGKALERQLREAFPTAAFAGGLGRALSNGGARGLRHAETLNGIIQQHEDFDLLTTAVDQFLSNVVDPKFGALAQNDSFRNEVKAAQRVFRLAPTFEATDMLLADDLHSAQRIYRQGEAEFVRRYADTPGFTVESAQLAWNRAAYAYAGALTLVGELSTLNPEGLPAALRSSRTPADLAASGAPATSTAAAAAPNFPNWNNLFQSGDLCECEHCRSVLSPAAYFADLLTFLKDRTAKNSGRTVKDILFDRRPDLGFIELGCDNALTPLPYVDVVCEALEAVVIPGGGTSVPLPSLTAIPATSGAGVVTAALVQHGLDPGTNVSLSQIDSNRWVAHGDDATYLVTKTGSTFSGRVLPNTKASAAELRAYPAYVDAAAYVTLRAARFPFNLPFDLFGEEVRAAFRKCNLQRFDLMRTLRGSAAPNNPSDGDIACEYFGISCDANAVTDEKTLILVADTNVPAQQAIWGESGNANWLDTTFATLPLPTPFPPPPPAFTPRVALVKTFLRKTGLEYDDLFALLDLKFINPSGAIFIEHLDNSCDTDKKVLRGLDIASLDRIHRFLRLWRKLGWKMWEVDLVVGSPGVGNGALDEPFLINLCALSRLRTRLGEKTTVEQLCALCGPINTETHFTKLYEKRGAALYQSLFLNKRLAQPLDHAFDVAALGTTTQISAHLPVMLAALRVSETDLAMFTALTVPPANTVPYINDDLTLANISFLWRHAWLSKQLKFKPQEWAILLKLCQQNVLQFVDSAAALAFVEMIDAVKASAFTPDELDWLLAGNRAAKAAVKETDAARFLTTLRKDLQAIHAEYDPAQYPFLNPSSDEEGLAALLTTLLGKLNRDEVAARAFQKTLHGSVSLEASARNLPAGFAFPPGVTGSPSYVPIQHDEPAGVFRFAGVMTDNQQTFLLDDTKPALATLQTTGQLEASVPGLLPPFTFPAQIPIQYDAANHVFRFTGLMTDADQTTLLSDPSLASVTADQRYRNAIEELREKSRTALASYRSAIEDLYRQSLVAGDSYVTVEVTTAAAGVMVPADRPSLPIRYIAASQKLSFTGVMTDNERTALIDEGNPVDEITELFDSPRLAVKFFDPAFTAPLDALPPTIDFKMQLSADLASKMSYDVEQRVLRANGILSKQDLQALDLLSSDALYRAAVQSLFDQPRTGTFLPDRIWLEDVDLQGTAVNKLAGAVNQVLAYLSRTLSDGLVVQQTAAQLGLTEALTRYLTTQYSVVPNGGNPPITLLAHLTGPFAASGDIVAYTTPARRATFDGWYWACRAAALWKKWKVALAVWQKLDALPTSAQLLRLPNLPVNNTMPIAPMDRFLHSSRLIRIKDSLPETGTAFIDVLGKLAGNGYATAADFAADVERLNDAWAKADVGALVTALDAAYPNAYLLAETWERLYRAFYFLDSLNAGASRVLAFAAATMGAVETKTLKDLLRAKFGPESWLDLSADIQDALRERKREALAAYLLAGQMPVDAPSGKWENTNDLYAYYLLDVEMCSCQLTSRLVQASGSVQLFVQRCFMGLEPGVVVQPDGGDGAWRWWAWMRKYRVWEANHKVFLWPENWIEPELKKDRSPFFKELETELQQNEINQYTVEAAFANYLEKLDGVAQLEIAGFYQEDDGDDAIIHVFGRTGGAEPHLYYYRRYDYRQWTPWEKVELDIQGDYLIPAVIANRLFLFWPVLTEVPDESSNSTVTTPAAESSAPLQKVVKRVRLEIALSDYRQGKWTPKRISKDFDVSTVYTGEASKWHYTFPPIDRSMIDGRFDLQYSGFDSDPVQMSGSFGIASCSGVPERTYTWGLYTPVEQPAQLSTGELTKFMKWTELRTRYDGHDDFELVTRPTHTYGFQNAVLARTPGLFSMTPAWHLSYFDKLVLDGQAWSNPWFAGQSQAYDLGSRGPLGSWLPFFYNDRKRTFFVLPTLSSCRSDGATPVSKFAGGDPNKPIAPPECTHVYYPRIKRQIRDIESMYAGLFHHIFSHFVLPAAGSPDGQWIRQFLAQQFPNESPPATDAQARDLLARFWMRLIHYYLGLMAMGLLVRRQWNFKIFYHPFVCDFLKLVNNPLQGIAGLMQRETQFRNTGFSFKQTYQPTPWVIDPPAETFYPKEDVDFSPDGAYSSYNWELFFHAPLLIANALSRNQRFAEAREWYHFIFNPIGVESGLQGGSTTSKYWITKPFYETTGQQYVQQRIDNILSGNANLEDQVRDWRTNPFEPHRIANYRTVAYQKTVVMKYLDNLIAWGDFLFGQDSMESINEATQLYVLADEILGERPRKIPPQAKPPLQSFNELENEFDALSNALVQVENLVPQLSGSGGTGNAAPLPMLYFCIPNNDKMLGYWDTIADRLYKIRHCMNIEGVVRQLALFEPPIDPAALVKAVAGGVDIGSALADLNASLPLYRFQTLLQKANEVCGDVKALGGALISALEKKDAEALSLLRQGQEMRVLQAATAVREKQIEEAKENLTGVKKSKAVAETRRNYYRDIEQLSSKEKLHLDKMTESQKKQQIAQGIKIGASIISLLPAIDLGASGFGGTPLIKFKLGGLELGQAASLASDVLSFLSQIAANDATMASINAGNERRWADWKLQERLADRELEQFDSQIAAAELRIAVAEKELANHLLQIDNAKAIDEFMRSKYTNEELYQWQVGQVSGVYFQSYKLAYDLAKRAERCFRFELGLQDSSYISFGYWDSLKKGLLSGEKLQYDLRRLESAYLEQNRRELELTKHVSLMLNDPLALVQLRETGKCFLRLPEEIFDLDYPGHYFRRIKSVSLTLPCVTGPYTTIACTLRLLKNSLRINTANGDNGYPRNTDDQGSPADDTRFIENNIPVKAIAASSGQNDSGVFELNFRDERYLPFEGAGAISEWSLELFNDLPSNNPDPGAPDFGKPLRQFDYGTISDAIVHIKYMAREDAGPFKNGVVTHLRDYYSQDDTTPSLRLFNLRQEFPSQWSRFLNPTLPANGNVFELKMSADLFRSLDVGKSLKVNTIWFLARCTGSYSVTITQPPPATPPPPATAQPLATVQKFGDLKFVRLDAQSVTIDPAIPWAIKLIRTDGVPALVEDMFLVLGYEWD